MPSVPALCADMPREELKQYLKEYSTESGEKLFAAANVDMLEHLPMSTVYEASKSSAKWETVANMLFPDSKGPCPRLCRGKRVPFWSRPTPREPSRPCSGGLASGAHRGTSRRAAGAGSLFTEG